MNTDLMRSSGLKTALYEREILKTLKHVEMRDGVLLLSLVTVML